MKEISPLFLLVAGCVALLTMVYTALWGPRARARRRVARGNTAIVDGATVTLAGTVRALGDTLVAPLSGTPCVAYHAYAAVPVEHMFGQDMGSVVEQDAVTFALDTPAGRVLVQAKDARLEIALDHVSVIPRNIERERDLCQRQGFTGKVAALSFKQVAIADGDRIAVFGMAVAAHDLQSTTERSYRDGAPMQIQLMAPPNQALTIDRPRRRAA